MYTVTNEYETYVKSEARNYSMTGSIVNKNNVTMQITRDNILEGSLSFTNRCTANNSFDIGGCCIGSMEITLQGDYHHSLYNAVITLQQGVYVTGDTYHMEKVGTWIIKKAHWNGEWVTLECYDAMCLTQKKYSLTTGSFTPYSFFTAMCNDCGITLATTQAEIEAMVNGTATLIFNGSTQETDRKWSDLIHDMCAVICGFCSINRFGNLEVHQFGKCYKRIGAEKTYYTAAVDTLTKNDRITGGAFGNGAINITGLYINDRASKNADKSILVGNTSGTTLNLGYNRWLSSATSGYATMLQNILTQLTACQFYAADVHLADVSLYDLGDLITLQAGGELSLSEDILMCVMNIDYNFADESTISSYTFSEASDSSTSAVETNLTNRIETLESAQGGGGNKIYISELAPTVEDNAIGNEGDLWYKVKRRGHFEGAVLKCVRAGIMTEPNMEFSVGQYVRINYGNHYNNNAPCIKYVDESWAGYNGFEYISLSASGITNATTTGKTSALWGHMIMQEGSGGSALYGMQSLRLWTCNYDEERMITSNESAVGGFGRTAVGYDIGYQGKNYYRWSTESIAGILTSIYYDAATSDEHMVDPAAVQATFDSFALFEIVDWGEGTSFNYDGTIIERMTLERYVKYDGVWVTADYKAGKGIVIADGEIRINTSTSVDIIQTVTSGTQLATINGTSIYAPTVSATQTLSSGTEIGSVTVGSTSTTLYAPTPQSVSVTQTLASGTEIGSVTIDNNTTTLYAPTGGGSDVTVTPKTSTGTNIADISVDGTTYNLFAPSGGGGEAIETAFIYSNEERVVGVWTDNRPLYQKTLNLTSPSRVFEAAVIADLTSLNIENLVKVEGFLYSATYSQTLPIYWSYAVNNSDIRNSNWGTVYYENTYLKQNLSSTAYTQCPVTITVQYTKTTDTPGSAPYITSGAYAHHYSTTEQVVGTWIDGSTIYEKTQYGGITFSSQGTWYNTDITNIDKVVSVQGSINKDGEPINLGYWNSSIVSCWILRDHTLKMSMSAMASGETYTLNSITVRYTKPP